MPAASRTGVVMRADAYVSPLAAGAIELIELGFAAHAREKARRPPGGDALNRG